MASITSMMNSSYNTSSIYGTRNVLSGLASGMDTETMIENAVSGIKMKIQNLLKKRTKVEWKQDAYRSIIDKAVNLGNKYTSYSSKTNLLSGNFFTSAVTTTAKGTYSDKISATGRSSSDIRINAVKQMATSASYTVSGAGTPFSGVDGAITSSKDFDIGGALPVSKVTGSLTFKYGGANGASFTIRFDELENVNEVEVLNEDGTVKEDATNAEKLAQAIRNKLGEITYSYNKYGYQETTTADKAIKVSVEDGEIKFSDGLDNGNSVVIDDGNGQIINTLDIYKGDTSLKLTDDTELTEDTSLRDYLKGKTLSFSYNGTTKKIEMDDILEKIDFHYGDTEYNNAEFRKVLQDELDDTFGKDKVKVSFGEGENAVLSFTAKHEGDVLSVGGTAVEALGFEDGDANYINATKKLSEIMGDRADSVFTTANRLKAEGDVTEKYGHYLDSNGNKVEQAEDGNYYRIDDSGKAIYDFEINGAHIQVTEDTTLEDLMTAINSNTDAGMKVSYSRLTNEFKFTATATGAKSKVEMGGLAKAMFGASGSGSDSLAERFGIDLGEDGSKFVKITTDQGNAGFYITSDMTMEEAAEKAHGILNKAVGATVSYDELSGQILITDKNGKTLDYKVSVADDITASAKELEYRPDSSYTTGTDAIMDVEINGKRFENLTRSSNTFDLDGMSVTVKGAFNENGLGVDKDGNAIEPITFETVTDSDKIIDAIRDFVNDYNEMVTELKGAYSTLPAQKTDGSSYDPLTAEEEDSLTESELASYNEKAKQGILFGDTTLSSMYSRLLSAISPGGANGQALREIGISTSYENGLTTLSLDEDKLRATLESDPDKVKDVFTKTASSGSSGDGLMQTLQNTLNTYVKTTGEPKGVLITKAGSVKAPTSLNNNSLNTQMSNIDREIERWQNKMASQIDRYTTQFSRLEQLMAQMEAQYSAMAGLMGGSEGYY